MNIVLSHCSNGSLQVIFLLLLEFKHASKMGLSSFRIQSNTINFLTTKVIKAFLSPFSFFLYKYNLTVRSLR